MSSADPISSGAFVIRKDPGLSSSQVVGKLKWTLTHSGLLEKPLRIGHGGTLDPFASGVLVVLFGEATKLADCYLHSTKTYHAVAGLGVQMDSGDLTGTRILTLPVPALNLDQWQSLADAFVKQDYFQTPPMHSAKKKDGVPLYELAHQGLSIERSAILKKIHSLRILKSEAEHLEFEVSCESGTYIRVLAEDLAGSAETCAHLTSLVRIRSSDRSLEESRSLTETVDQIESGTPLAEIPNLIPLDRLATHVPALEIPQDRGPKIQQGQSREIEALLHAARTQGTDSRYVIAKVRRGSRVLPLALLERVSNQGFRLQRVFNLFN